MTLFLIKQMEIPNMDNPWIILAVTIMLASIFIPCIIWFIRNFIRIVLNKNIEWLNRSLKWFFLIGFIFFIISIIFLILIANGVIR